MNAHDAVIDAVLKALRLGPAVTNGLIDEDIDADEVPEEAQEVVSVAMAASTPARGAILGHPIDWRTEVAVTCFARSDGRTPAGRASRALHAKVFARLTQDPTLGGVAFYVEEPDITAERDPKDTRLGSCTGIYPVSHRTAARTLEV